MMARIPADVLAKLTAFMESGGTGRMLINVNRGRIESAELTERLNVRTADDQAAAGNDRRQHPR